jgi:hypothetical protein
MPRWNRLAGGMIGLFCFALAVLASPFRSKLRLEAENAVLRHQLNVLRRRLYGRVWPTNQDRWFFVQMYRWFPSIPQVLTIIRPEMLVRWHKAGFRCYWRWKSRPLAGRPPIDAELRGLIRRMSMDNPLWGAPRIHGGLLKLGFGVAQSSVAKYMIKRRRPPSREWQTFLRNHAPDIAAMDLFASASPWQNGYAERLIGSIRRERVDHVIVLGAAHLRRILKSYARYYNETRTHLALDKDAPLSRTVKRAGRILCRPMLGGLHHEYVRI